MTATSFQPTDAGGSVGQVMDPFGDAVVGQDEVAEQCHIVEQAARRVGGGDPPEPFDGLASFMHQPRAVLAMASSRPLTKPVSRLSKKAWATSIYSEMTVAVGTSGRASNS